MAYGWAGGCTGALAVQAGLLHVRSASVAHRGRLAFRRRRASPAVETYPQASWTKPSGQVDRAMRARRVAIAACDGVPPAGIAPRTARAALRATGRCLNVSEAAKRDGERHGSGDRFRGPRQINRGGASHEAPAANSGSDDRRRDSFSPHHPDRRRGRDDPSTDGSGMRAPATRHHRIPGFSAVGSAASPCKPVEPPPPRQ